MSTAAPTDTTEHPCRVLVTGATGFLGGALSRQLHRRGHQVTGTGRNLQAGRRLEEDGIRFVQADLTHAGATLALCQGQDVVVHCAALSSPWGPEQDFYAANVVATKNVANSAHTAGVERLVHISSPSIYTTGGDLTDIAEDQPATAHPLNHYIATKIEAEAVVRQAEQRGLATVIIRPRGLFGPGDPSVLPRLMDRLEAGILPVIGTGDNVADLTYIDNAADAVRLAVEVDLERVRGGVYNITNGQPAPLWDLVRELCRLSELPPPSKRVPFPVAYAIGWVLEWLHRTVITDREPRLTRYSAVVLGRTTTLNIDRARRDLGYEPRIDLYDGLRRYLTWRKARSREAAP